MTNTATSTVQRDLRKKRGFFARFKKDKRGSVAIEFSFLAMPFFLIIFAIIESCYAFTVQQVMTNTTDLVARSIRVNRLTQAAASGTVVRDRICAGISSMVSTGCPGLEVDIKVYPSYAAVPTTIPRTADNDVNTSGFASNVGVPENIQHLRVFYRWPYMTDFIGHKLAQLPNNKTLLFASATWKNEPL